LHHPYSLTLPYSLPIPQLLLLPEQMLHFRHLRIYQPHADLAELLTLEMIAEQDLQGFVVLRAAADCGGDPDQGIDGGGTLGMLLCQLREACRNRLVLRMFLRYYFTLVVLR